MTPSGQAFKELGRRRAKASSWWVVGKGRPPTEECKYSSLLVSGRTGEIGPGIPEDGVKRKRRERLMVSAFKKTKAQPSLPIYKHTYRKSSRA